MLKLTNISKSYGKKQVLKDITLDFSPGQVYGIAGENGAGKTTLFNCLIGLQPCHGTISSPFNILKNHVGFLPTHPVFLSKITGWEYLKLYSLARGINDENFEAQNVFDLPLQDYAKDYSTGMKKKLAFMAILLQKNDIYILDEPYNGVDLQSNIKISALIHELKTLGKIIIISSHIFSTLKETCDTIHLLRDGYISMTASKEHFDEIQLSLLENPTHTHLRKLKLS